MRKDEPGRAIARLLVHERNGVEALLQRSERLQGPRRLQEQSERVQGEKRLQGSGWLQDRVRTGDERGRA
jgi:hypothetical protein